MNMDGQFKDAALILVDIQNDFCPGGALAVAEGDEIVATVNRLMPRFPLVVSTQDWHPAFLSKSRAAPGSRTAFKARAAQSFTPRLKPARSRITSAKRLPLVKMRTQSSKAWTKMDARLISC
jgi:nicotinamidase-related amidase